MPLSSSDLLMISLDFAKQGKQKQYVMTITIAAMLRLEQLRRLKAPRPLLIQAEQLLSDHLFECAEFNIWPEQLDHLIARLAQHEDIMHLLN